MAALVSSTAGGQGLSPTLSDATIVSRGAVRFRTEMQWTRIDGVFGPAGVFQSVGGRLTGDLTTSTLPLLGAGQTAAQILANDPGVTLNAGRLTTSADSRIATVPITVEYGLTSRLALGVTIPIVQTRTVVTTQLNGKADSSANLGTNPARFHNSPAAYAQNAAVFNAMDAALTQLEMRRTECAASPALPGCAEVNARSDEAGNLVAAASGFTSAIGVLYGVSPGAPGAPFVPLSGSALQLAIDARLAQLRAAFTSFGYNAGSGSLAAAQAQAANSQLQRLVNDPEFGIALDSIGTTEQTAIGDIELSASTLLFNSFGRSTGLKMRGVAAGIVRLGTGHTPRPSRPFDIGTGDGQTDIEARAAVDAQTGRLLTTLAATYTVQMGSVSTARLRSTPGTFFDLNVPVPGSVKLGNMMSARLNPRYLITPALTAGALGVVSHRGADEVTIDGSTPGGPTEAAVFTGSGSFTVVAGGVTLAYSNVSSALGIGGRGFPAEIVFTHLQTVSASDQGAEHRRRDSIELRVYFRTRR